MVDAATPVAAPVRTAFVPLVPQAGFAARTLRLDRPHAPEAPLWRLALIGLGPLGVLALIGGVTALGRLLGR